MKLYANTLADHLKKQLAPVYLVASDDILLQNEAVDDIRAAAKKKGHLSREVNVIVDERNFDWQAWQDSAMSMSLFAEQRVLELHTTSSRIGAIGSDTICRFLDHCSSDDILLIVAPRLEASQQRAKWVKTIDKLGAVLALYTPEGKELAGWLQNRARQNGLKLDTGATQLLLERIEGNLLSASQELEKLALLVPEGSLVDAELISRAVADSARFSAFTLLDHALAADPLSASRALRHIRQQGDELFAITAATGRQLRELLPMTQAGGSQQAPAYLPAKKKKLLNAASQRLDAGRIEYLLRLLASAERCAKTDQRERAWDTVEVIALALAGKNLPLADLHLHAS